MRFEGIITPMITPFRKNGEVDYDATTVLMENLKKYGVNGIFPLGSTGVFPFLSRDERERFLKHVIENSKGLPVIAGVGSSSTQEAVSLGKKAAELGADALVLMPTYYITPGNEEIKEHFKRFLDAIEAPTFIYNIPQLTQAWIQPETAKWIKSEYSQVVGLKESSGDMRYFSKLAALRSEKFEIFQGQDDLLIPSLSVGADGGVCGTTNFSDSVVRAYRAYREGSNKKAMEIQIKEINPLIHSLQRATFPSLYYHLFYHVIGIEGGFRAPMLKPWSDLQAAAERSLGHVSSEKI